MEAFGKIIDILKSPKLAAILFFFSAFLLFANPEWIAFLNLDFILKHYKHWVGLSFLGSSAVLFVEFLVSRRDNYRLSKKMCKENDDLFQAFDSLDPKEIAVLREFIIQGQSTLSFPFIHPVIAGLIKKRILVPVSNYGEPSLIGPLLPMTLNNDLMPCLSLKKVNLPEGEPTDEIRDWVMKNRPEFMGQINRMKSLYYDRR